MEKPVSFVQRLKELAESQKREASEITSATSTVVCCPKCGAGRAANDGLARCAYCGHRFIQTSLGEGIHIGHEDNSR